jgi:hypothetical protein
MGSLRALLASAPSALLAGCWADFPATSLHYEAGAAQDQGGVDTQVVDASGDGVADVPGVDGPGSDLADAPRDRPAVDEGQQDSSPPPDTVVPPDSHVPQPDQPQPSCPTICDSCQGNTCKFDGAKCNNACTCPSDWHCEITCGPNECTNKIYCDKNKYGCTITCADSACTDEILCGSTSSAQDPCVIECSGADSCTNKINCSSSCECEVSCSGGPSSCTNTITCNDFKCNVFPWGGCDPSKDKKCRTCSPPYPPPPP